MTREEEVKHAAYAQYCNSESICFTLLCNSFKQGAEWADNNPKSPWISVKDDLPCNHKELVEFNRLTNKYSTKFILVIDSNGCVQLTFMEYDRYDWIWDRWEVLYWMPIPKLPKE